jgi:uncharacterized protein
MAGILTDDMKRVVAEQKLAFVATVCPDGTPNLSPKGTITVWGEDQLVFADIRSPGTIANLRANPAMEINVVDPFARKGYRFQGTAEVVAGDEKFEQIMSFYRGRWVDSVRTRAEASIRAFVVMKVECALPLVSPAYDDPANSEESVRKSWIAHYEGLHRR